MVLPAMSDISSNLLTIDDAAELLGVSRATFNRSRERLGLRPVPSARLKPILFNRAEVEAARNGAGASESYALPNGTLTINHDLPAHSTAAAMLNDPKLKATIRTAKTILERKTLLPLRTVKAAGRKGAGK